MGSPEWPSTDRAWAGIGQPWMDPHCIVPLGIPSGLRLSGAEHLPGDGAAAIHKLGPGRMR